MQQRIVPNRVIFPPGKQEMFLKNIKQTLNLPYSELTRLISISNRTFADWKREKFSMSLRAAGILCRKAGIKLPRYVEIRDPFWYTSRAGRLGAFTRMKIYGNPGTPEGRSKGGKISYAKRVAPIKAGVAVEKWTTRKEILKPIPSVLLAEFIGALLGDGMINHYQVQFTAHKEEFLYHEFLEKITKELFGLSGTHATHGKDNAITFTISSRTLVEYLNTLGISSNPTERKVSLPEWIFVSRGRRLAFLRGIFDTEGSVYSHRYKVNGKCYHYTKISIANRAQSILHAVEQILSEHFFHPRRSTKNDAIVLENSAEVRHFVILIKPHNTKHLTRFYQFHREESHSLV